MMERKRKGKRVGLWIGGVVLSGLVVFAAAWAATSSRRVDRILEEYAYTWNMRCPWTLDLETTVERVVILPGRVLVYQLSNGSFSKEILAETNMEIDQFREETRRKMLEKLLEEPDLKNVKRMGVTFRYVYKYTDGDFLMEFDITPEDYK